VFHPHWRQLALSRLDQTFDLLVIGGGITGCGVMLDAAQRGLRVLLIEKQDFAAGTSSRSSKMIHGGVRYLKQMQFRITRQASRERDRMVMLNPHLVRPIRFLYPANKGDQMPSWTVDLGLWMYDRLTSRPEKHTHLSVEQVLEAAPGLAVDELEDAMAYTDAMTDDARLTLAAAATGFAYGGLVLTRAVVTEPLLDTKGKIGGAVVHDQESGDSHEVRAHLVVNAAGVWVDRIREAFGIDGKRLRPSRGTHVIVPRERLPLTVAATVPAPDDGRPVFLVPHPEGTLVGTTDIFHEGSLDDPRPAPGEVSYLLRTLETQFPGRKIGADDVVGAFAGLRPILDTHAENPSEASRDEEVWHERGMLTIAGGKLTTWRLMAEEAVDEAVTHLPEERAAQAGPCLTAGTPFVGLAPLDLAERLVLEHDLDATVASAAARRLRSAAWSLPAAARGPEELRPLLDGTDLSAAEVRAHLRQGAVVRLEDFLLRRVRLGMWEPQTARAVAPKLRELFRDELGWSDSRWEKELDRYERAAQAWSPAGVREPRA
jgi:glycerol-3-phosphate dehydrogenase